MPMLRPLPTLTAFAVIIVSAVVDGLWTDRWRAAEAPQAAARKLLTVPLILGDWEGRTEELDARTLALAEACGYLQRLYVNRRTGTTVRLLVLCGRPGPVSVHPPEACYGGIGYEEVGARTKYTEPGPPPAEFWVYRFRKRDSALPMELRVLYSWGAAGAWRAVASPRVAFARQPLLYKMYVVRELSGPDEPLTEDPAVAFIRSLLPELEKSLFSPDERSS